MSTTGRPIALLVLAHALGVVTVGSIAVVLIGGLMEGQSLIQGLPFIGLLTITLAVGWLLAVRLPRHPVGWILMAVPALFTVSAPLNLLELQLGESHRGIAQWIDWYNGTDDNPSWSWLPPVWLLLSQLPLRFPTGRLPSPRWRWFAWVTLADLVVTALFLGTASPYVDDHHVTRNPVFLPVIHALTPLFPVVLAALAACFLVSVASLLVRYRGAPERERAQLRWMMWAVALAVLGLVLGAVLPNGLAWIQSWVLLLYALVPIAVAIAVLRYRLYEIDRIISRTAAYAVVTLLVIGTYALVVLLISLLLPGLQHAPIGVALATLAAAGVFLPALRWVRRTIDRVFNRSQYDAEQVVLAFGERIRNGADPHIAGADLVGAVGQTLQPSAIGLWTRSDPR